LKSRCVCRLDAAGPGERPCLCQSRARTDTLLGRPQERRRAFPGNSSRSGLRLRSKTCEWASGPHTLHLAFGCLIEEDACRFLALRTGRGGCKSETVGERRGEHGECRSSTHAAGTDSAICEGPHPFGPPLSTWLFLPPSSAVSIHLLLHLLHFCRRIVSLPS